MLANLSCVKFIGSLHTVLHHQLCGREDKTGPTDVLIIVLYDANVPHGRAKKNLKIGAQVKRTPF